MQTIGRNRRKDRRVANYLRRTCGYGKYVTGCRGHPGIVVKTFFDEGSGVDVDIQSLVDGTIEACSLTHCGIVPLSKKDAIEQAEYRKKYGEAATWAKYDSESLYEWIENYYTIPLDADPAKIYGAGMPIHEYLGITLEEYEQLVVRKEIP